MFHLPAVFISLPGTVTTLDCAQALLWYESFHFLFPLPRIGLNQRFNPSPSIPSPVFPILQTLPSHRVPSLCGHACLPVEILQVVIPWSLWPLFVAGQVNAYHPGYQPRGICWVLLHVLVHSTKKWQAGIGHNRCRKDMNLSPITASRLRYATRWADVEKAIVMDLGEFMPGCLPRLSRIPSGPMVVMANSFSQPGPFPSSHWNPNLVMWLAGCVIAISP